MDPLSDILSLLKPRGTMSGGIDAGGDWSIHFDEYRSFRCLAIVSGQCWIAVEEVPTPVLLEAGDCAVLPHGHSFRLASDLSLPPVGLKSVIQAPLQGQIRIWNGGGACLGLSALFTFDGHPADILLSTLPPILHIRQESGRAAMRWCLERMMQELREPRPGGFLLGQHLAQMMLVESLRLYLAEAPNSGIGWLYALADKQLNTALTCMHQAPAYRWTLEELATRAGMSRSIFALRFREKVGTTPMEYLTRWRMMLAADRLSTTTDSIATIAASLSYESESAFGKAFKRTLGRSPRQYHRGQATKGMGLSSNVHPTAATALEPLRQAFPVPTSR